MAKPKALLGALAAAAVALALAGCSSLESQPSADRPLSVERASSAAERSSFFAELPAVGPIHCFDSGEEEPMSCSQLPEGAAVEEELLDLKALGFGLRYVEATESMAIACLISDAGDNTVESCFPFDLREVS